ncbi:MAG: hypothetical protein ACMG6E_03925 [Candidatus Roizmanbacteria bacterium]
MSESDVMQFIDKAPIKILNRMSLAIAKRKEEDSRSAIARSLEKLGGKVDVSDAPLPGPGEELDASEQMMGLAPKVDTDDLRAQLKKVKKTQGSSKASGDSESLVFDSYEAELVYMFKDKTGNGMFKIYKDEALTKRMMKLKAHCDASGMYCPYGMGNSNDLLKVKGFACSAKGDKVRITIKLSEWNFNEKSGFTCYKL